MFIHSNGKIGIDTSTATEQLEVNGNVNITTGNSYEINGVAITDTTYLLGRNLSFDTFATPLL